MKKLKSSMAPTLVILACLLSNPIYSAPLGTAFTYQGQLMNSGEPADGDFDFKFNLLDGPDPLSATELASVTLLAVTVEEGLFSVEIDFGGVFTGDAVWLETEVRPAGAGGLTSLYPPHELTATPYALNAERFGGLEVSEVVTMEIDPTVTEHVKDGVSWDELTKVPTDLIDGDDVGITSESDPTVAAHVKDGISWTEILSRPSGLDDGDQVGITLESDPTVAASVKDGVSWTEIQGGQLSVDGTGKLGIGVPNPQNKLHVDGIIRANGFASETNNHVCKQGSGALSTCSSSIRYKRDVQDLAAGMEVIEQLRPVTFRWKGRDEQSVGFIAEEVADAAPLFVTHERGQIEGVRYGELTTLLVNALKQQQAEIDQLRSLLCTEYPEKGICRQIDRSR